jgi:uncharacterized GH25 family protein
MRTFSIALALLLVPVLARAHDLRVERDGGDLVLRYGHDAESLTLDASRVKSMRCVQPGGATELRDRAGVAPKELRVTARCDVLSASFDGGFWSLTPDGEKPVPRSQAPGAVKSWASRQYAKWVDRRSAQAAKVVGDELEIVPAQDLSRVRNGDKIALRVLLEGKPVAGALVSVGHKAIGETDSAGEVRLRVRGKDRETIGAVLRRKLSSADADTLVLEASLSFEVAP